MAKSEVFYLVFLSVLVFFSLVIVMLF